MNECCEQMPLSFEIVICIFIGVAAFALAAIIIEIIKEFFL